MQQVIAVLSYNHPYTLIKSELQIIGAIASSVDTLTETCKYILNNRI